MRRRKVIKFVGWLEFFQNRNKQKYAVTGANHIDEATYVKIDGIDLVTSIVQRNADEGLTLLVRTSGPPASPG